MWALRRRIIIVGLLIAALLLLVVFPYWLSHREVPTCFDGKQNQGEQGVDCGSPCALLCKGKAKDLNILWTKVFAIRTGTYDVVAYVENPNFDVGTQKFTYTATLYDASGNVIATQDGVDFARPSERFIIFAGNMLTGENVAKTGSVEIHPDFSWVTTPKSPPLFTISEKQLTSADHTPHLTALIHNMTPDIYRNIDVSAVIYDSKNNPIGVSSTKVDKLIPKGDEKLIFTWPGGFSYVAETEQCDTPVDVVLAVDRSGSMHDEDKIGQAKLAAEVFFKKLNSQDQGAFVSFANEATNPIDQPLTGNVERLTRAIDRTIIHTDGLQFTNIADAIRRSIDEFSTMRHNTDARPIIVLLTDGIPNRPLDSAGKGSEEYASQYAIQIANEAKKDNIALYTIGLGSDVNTKLMTSLATSPEYYYPAATGGELATIYQQIATAICKKNPSVIEIIPRVNDVVPSLQTP